MRTQPEGPRRPSWRTHLLSVGLLVGLGIPGCFGRVLGPSPEDVITLDVRVHLLEDGGPGPLTTTLSEAEVVAVFDSVNRIWEQARIEWSVESVKRTPVHDPPQARALMAEDAEPGYAGLASLIPQSASDEDGWDVFFAPHMGDSFWGVYFPPMAAVLQSERDPSGKRGPEGALPRILAHELGHSLGLLHVECSGEGNLMAPFCEGTDRTRLSRAQIEEARSHAFWGPCRGAHRHM